MRAMKWSSPALCIQQKGTQKTEAVVNGPFGSLSSNVLRGKSHQRSKRDGSCLHSYVRCIKGQPTAHRGVFVCDLTFYLPERACYTSLCPNASVKRALSEPSTDNRSIPRQVTCRSRPIECLSAVTSTEQRTETQWWGPRHLLVFKDFHQ